MLNCNCSEWFMVLESVRRGWIQEPKGWHREPVSFSLSALLSELLAFFPGRVRPGDCRHVRQRCELTFHQLSNPSVRSTALARVLFTVQPGPGNVPWAVGCVLDWPHACHCDMGWNDLTEPGVVPRKKIRVSLPCDGAVDTDREGTNCGTHLTFEGCVPWNP